MKKTVGVLSLFVMLLSQVFTPFAYAVSGEEVPISELVVEEIVPEPEVVEPVVIPEVDNSTGNNNSEIDKTNTGGVVEPVDVEVNTGTVISTGEETKNLEEEEVLTGTEVSSGFIEIITESIKNFLGINGEEEDDAFESREIYGTLEYEGVKVEVYAQTGLFASGTELTIELVVEEKLEAVQEVLLSGEVDFVDEQVIAFDITFSDPVTQEELQPKDGTVQVTFNYEENENLVQAEENEKQEVKVYHLNDIDEKGNKIEELIGTTVEEVNINEDKREEANVMVVEVGNFSVYTIVVQVKEEGPKAVGDQLANFEYGEISIEDPDYPGQGITVMDRNLGALEAGTGEKSYGYYYQWGNNYGFSKNSIVASGMPDLSAYANSDNNDYYSGVFIADWSIGYNLWGGTSVNLPQKRGPCPDGWHVPDRTEWNSLITIWGKIKGEDTNYTSFGTTYQRILETYDLFLDIFKIPLAGNIYSYDGIISYTNQNSYFWLSNYDKIGSNHEQLTLGGTYVKHIISDSSASGGYGYPIRCFKNEYTPVQYKVKFHFNGMKGFVVEESVGQNGKVKEPFDPELTGHVVEWYDNIELSGDAFDFDNTTISNDIDLYAKYICSDENLCKRTVSFQTNGGSNISPVQTNDDLLITLPEPPTKEGFVFVGWYEDETLLQEFDPSTKILVDTFLYAKWGTSINLTLNANGGEFEDGNNVKILEYTKTKCGTKYSHTPNVGDDGVQNFNYYNNSTKNEVVTIDGANALHIKIVYGGESNTYDWVSMWEGNHPEYTAAKNYSTSVTGKLGGGSHTSSSNVKEYDVVGDTVTFAFKSDVSGVGDGYGYYAIIEGFTIEPGYGIDLEEQNPSMDGYEFLGWHKAGSFEYYDLEKGFINDITLYAVWKNSNESNLTTTLLPGSDFNKKIKSIAKGSEVSSYYNSDSLIRDIKRESWIPWGIDINEEYNRISLSSEIPIYAWFSGGVLHYFTEAGTVYMNEDSSYMFSYFNSFTDLDLTSFNVEKVKNMNHMFYYCNNLTNINLSNWDTHNVTNMESMFQQLNKMTNIDLSNFDTSNVTNMYLMFSYSSKLTSVNLSNWDTSKVTDMRSMFSSCSSLTSIDLSSWDTSSLTNISSMFSYCSKLTNVNLSNWNTSNVTNMSKMFNGCNSLTSINLSSFNTSNVTDMSHMFDYCSKLTYVEGSFNTSKVTDMSYMFNGCSKLTNIDVSNWNTSNVTSMSYMFDGCSELTNINVSSFNTSNVTDMSHMFNNCSKLESISTSNFDTSKVTNMSYMFNNCSKLESISTSNFDTSKVTNMSHMFNGCSKLTNIDVSNFDTSKVTDMNSLFSSCSELTNINVSNFDTSKVTDMSYMFNGCSKLTNIDVSNFNTSNVTSMSYMFNGCSKLTNIDVSNFNTSNVISMSYMFNGCSELENLYVNNFSTKGLKNMEYMFNNCSKIEILDISNFDTSSVTDMSHLFSNCTNLRTIYAGSRFRTSNASSSSSLFSETINVVGGSGTVYNSTNVGINYARIDNEYQSGYFTQSGFINTKSVAYLLKGSLFNTTVKGLAINGTVSDYYTPDTLVTGFQRAESVPSGVITGIISTEADSDAPVYARFKDGIIYYWTDADIIEMNGNSSYMFYNFKSLISSDITDFHTNSVTNMSYLFGYCSSLTNVDLSNFDTSSVSDIGYMFYNCSSLTNVDLSNFDTSRVTSISSMFYNCSNLRQVNLSNWNFGKVSSLGSMFYGCSNLKELNFDGWNLQELNGSSFSNFLSWNSVDKLSAKGWKLPKNAERLMYNIASNISLEEMDVSNWDLSKTETLSYVFYNLSVKKIVGINTWSGTNVKLTDMSYMFKDVKNLEEIDMSNMDFSKVTTVYEMFQSNSSNGSNLKRINLSNTKFDSLENIAYICQYCSNLEEINLSNIDININNKLSSYALFQYSYNLKKVNLDNFGKIKSTYAWFQNNYNLTGLDLRGVDTSETIDMSYMFYGTTGFKKLNLTSMDTTNVTDMRYMFKDTTNLKTIYVGDKFKTGSVIESTDMFKGAVSIVGGNGTIYDPDNIDVTYARIDNEYQSGYFTDPNHFSVKFLTITGEEVGRQWISTGQTVEELEDSHKSYRYYTSGDLQTGFDFTEPLYAYTEIYVTWDDVKHVSYEYGTGVEEGIIYSGSCVVENGEDRSQKSESCEVTLPEPNVLTGYHTPLWYKKGTNITYPNLTITLTGDVILEAKAIANSYTVVYKPGEGTGEMESQEFEYDKEGILNKNKYSKEGYHFSGWIDLLGKEYRDGEKVLNLLTEGVLELTAQWLQNPPAAGGGQSITPATKEQEHNAAEEKPEDKQESNQDKQQDETVKDESKTPENTNTSNQTNTQQSSSTSSDNSYKTVVDPEIQSAYEWAYERDVTTIPSLDDAMPDGVVTRGHLAKMVVNYATNVLGREIPEKIPSECRWNDWRKDWESEEIKDYAVKSCALGLMGLDMPKFLPNMEVTRAQFGTIMSRLLWGKKYAGGTPYYRKHLNALKENNIMTQIENPEKRVELRQWVWLMLMRSAENK